MCQCDSTLLINPFCGRRSCRWPEKKTRAILMLPLYLSEITIDQIGELIVETVLTKETVLELEANNE